MSAKHQRINELEYELRMYRTSDRMIRADYDRLWRFCKENIPLPAAHVEAAWLEWKLRDMSNTLPDVPDGYLELVGWYQLATRHVHNTKYGWEPDDLDAWVPVYRRVKVAS